MLLRASLVVLALLILLFILSLLGAKWAERRYPPIGQFIEVDGLRLHYLLQGSGDGPALLLIHGASSNLRDFAASILPQLAANHRVIAFDRPGYGFSQRPRGQWPDPARVARLLLDACERLGIEKPVLLGHSWGGSVVMSAMVEMPERLSGGIMLSAVAGHWTGSVGWTYDLGKVPLVGPLFARTLVFPVGMQMLDQAVVGVLEPNPVPDRYVQDLGLPLTLRARSFLNNVDDMTRLSDYMQSLSPRYDRIETPLLFLHGSQDKLVPFWNHGRRVLPVVKQAEAVRIEGAGHAPHHSHPHEVLDAIDQFMSRLGND